MERKNIEQLSQDLNRRLLEIARKVDPHDEQVIDMYAEEIAGDFCRAGMRDIAAGLQAADPNAPKQDFCSFREEAMPNLPFFREMAAGFKRQIFEAVQSVGKSR